jgi:hypothetical protein
LIVLPTSRASSCASRQAHQHAATIGRRHLRPRPAFKCAPRRAHGAIDIDFAAARDCRKDFAVGGTQNVDASSIFGVGKLSIDNEAVMRHGRSCC